MKVLLLSYYAPPLNAITSMRAYTLGKQLSLEHEVHLVTRSWTGSESTWPEMLQDNPNYNVLNDDSLEIHYLPYKEPKQSKSKIKRRLALLKAWSEGRMSPELTTDFLYQYVMELTETIEFDILYATAPPTGIIRTAMRIKADCGIPATFIDFRDLMNHLTLDMNSKPKVSEKIKMKFLEHSLKKTLSQKGVYVSVASEPYQDVLQAIGISDTQLILNGYEQRINDLQGELDEGVFKLVMLGTIYMHQEKDVLIHGLNRFLESNPKADIQISCLGLDTIPEVGAYFRNRILDSRFKSSKRLDREQALRIGKGADILFYIGWPGHRGMYSGKIFEYLGLKRRILIAPGDEDVIDRLLTQTESGCSAYNSAEVADILQSWYEEWKQEGGLHCESKNTEMYTREHQNALLINKMESIHLGLNAS